MLDKIANALLEHETIGEKHFEALFTQETVDWDSIKEAGLLEKEETPSETSGGADASGASSSGINQENKKE